MKTKTCGNCGKEGALWAARTKNSPGLCKECAAKQKSLSEPKKEPTIKPISKISSKQAKINAAYSVLRKAFLDQHPICQAHLPGCTYHATDVHHSAGRGKYTLDATTFVALCRSCHRLAEEHPLEAKELGLSKNRL